jgi:cytochrome c biogenesis protein CcdA
MQVMKTGSAPSVNEAYRWGLSKLAKLSLSAVMSWFLVGLGTLLCIIPGVILSCAFHVVYPVAVFEKGSPVDVLKRSYKLTEGYRLNIFGAGIVLGIVGFVCIVPVSITVAVMAANGMNFLPLQIVLAIYSDIATEIQTVFSLVVYLSILRTLGRGHSILE